MKQPLTLLAAAALVPLGAALAADMKAELDCAADPKLLDTHFTRYGHDPGRAVAREPQGLRFRLPAAKGVVQTGVYSRFQLAGDFDVTVTYELIDAPPPKEGYGVTCGLAVDTDGSGGSAAVTRGFRIKEANGYFVEQGKVADGGITWEPVQTVPCATKTKTGKLGLKREKKELVCLYAEPPSWEFFELCRIPFSEGPVRKIRIFADTGGSPTPLDARISDIKIQAEALAKREEPGSWGWLLALAALVVFGAAAFLIYRRLQAKD
jgi:hypothetical protein